MLFGSVTFLFLFLPIALLVYYIIPKRFKNPVLLAASLFFYAWGNVLYLPLLVLSIIVNYFCGRAIGSDYLSQRRSTRILICGIVFNLGLLAVFKYFGSFASAAGAASRFGSAFARLAVPIGISFFTLQALSYLFDVYRGNVAPQKNLMLLAIYISMFPQMLAGPVVRYEEIEYQLKERKLSWSQFGRGAFVFLVGLAKKTILANGIAALFTTALEQVSAGQAAVGTSWIGVIAFMLQIYFNFSGYSDMAIGLGFMFGFKFRRNFRYPYTSRSITKFLGNWNISLGRWFGEYVRTPLEIGRQTRSRRILNILILSALIGMWYGGSLTMIIWGLYCGALMILERYVWGRAIGKTPVIVRHIYTLALLLVGWVFFFSDTVADAVKYFAVMFGPGAAGGGTHSFGYLFSSNWLLLVVGVICCTAIPERILSRLGDDGKRRAVYIVAAVALFVLAVACLVTETNHPFEYFRF